MEVLSSYTPQKAHDASPYTSSRAASSSKSTLHHRASTASLDPHSKQALSVDHTLFVKFHGDSSRTGISVTHAAQISSASPRTFAPLTPIIASPVTTPTMSTTPLYVMSDKESAKEKLTAIQDSAHLERDSFIRTPFPPSDEKAGWINKISPTWTSTPPTPPKPPRYRSAARRASSSVPPSTSLPNSLNPRAFSSTDNLPKRRVSLPPMALSKPLPPTPPLPFSPLPRSRRSHRSRRPSQISESSLRDGIMEPNSGRSSKPIFHMLESGSDDDEETGSCTPLTASPKEMFLEQRIKAPGASETGWLKAKQQDDIRRYHALAELLTTEEGYLMDLRELVNAYIRQLPTLSCRPIANSSSNLSISPFVRSPPSATFMTTALSSTSRSPSHSQLPLALPNSSLVFPDGVPAPFKDKNTIRHMFSDEDLELVMRNIEEILHFHEAFVDELRTALIPLGFSMSGSEIGEMLHMKQKKDIKSPDPPLEAAIAVVSTIFTHKAARFDLYETFCAGHTEAFDLVRKAQQAYSMEWDAFEQRSSQLVADLRNPVPYTQTVEGSAMTPALDGFESFEARRKRRHSLSSLDVPTRPPRVRSNSNVKHAFLGPPDNGVPREKNSRLVFMDYLIKPIQRICKYPLLLDQLKTGKSFRTSSQEGDSSSLHNGDSTSAVDADAVVDVASQAMRRVASSVDEARRRQDILTKSSLIVTRISNSLATQSSSSMRSLVGHNLSPVFLSSLGACLLAGSIDVIHHYVDKIPGSSGTVKAKYLGAFLYMGGYIILVKISKGKVYEPRHWFSLVGFELVDMSEEDALLPCSFRLSSKGHHFDMAAACQREKDVWISAFRESLTLPPSWSNEPVSSLQAHGRSDFLLEDVSSEGTSPIPPMPTIQSIPELQGVGDGSGPAGVRTDTTLPRGQPRPDSVNLSLPPSRRSSTVSVKAIFSPASESTILIRRASPPARQQVERGLRDVFSDVCLSARSHASTHEEELFQAPKVIRSGFSRSSSGLGMAGMGVAAKNRLTKRESVLVQRRTSAIEAFVPPPDEDAQTGLLKRTSTAKSLANRRHAKKLKIVSMPLAHTSEGEGGAGEALPDTPPALSQCSSITASNAGSVSCSPVGELAPARALPIRANTNIPRPDLLVVHENDCRPKRSRSMVDNVKGIFQSRSSSPASSVSCDQSLPPSPQDPRPQLNVSLNSGLLKWWSGTIRRRARSAPGAPEDLLPFTSPTYSEASPTDSSTPPTVVRRNKTTKERRPGLLSTSESGQLYAYTEPATDSSAESNFQQQNTTPMRQQPSLFSSTTPRRQMKAFIKGDSTLSPRLQRNLSFLQRLSPLTPATSHSETA